MGTRIRNGDQTSFPQSGQSVTVHLVGWLASTGKEFVAKDNFTFRLGNGEVIRGLDDCIPQMSRGEKVKLEIPAARAYGDTSMNIPPNADLIFEVDLVDIKNGERVS